MYYYPRRRINLRPHPFGSEPAKELPSEEEFLASLSWKPPSMDLRFIGLGETPFHTALSRAANAPTKKVFIDPDPQDIEERVAEQTKEIVEQAKEKIEKVRTRSRSASLERAADFTQKVTNWVAGHDVVVIPNGVDKPWEGGHRFKHLKDLYADEPAMKLIRDYVQFGPLKYAPVYGSKTDPNELIVNRLRTTHGLPKFIITEPFTFIDISKKSKGGYVDLREEPLSPMELEELGGEHKLIAGPHFIPRGNNRQLALVEPPAEVSNSTKTFDDMSADSESVELDDISGSDTESQLEGIIEQQKKRLRKWSSVSPAKAKEAEDKVSKYTQILNDRKAKKSTPKPTPTTEPAPTTTPTVAPTPEPIAANPHPRQAKKKRATTKPSSTPKTPTG